MNEEEKRKYEAFQYWIQTNTERGVTTIPDNLCLFVVNLIKSLQKENEELKAKWDKDTHILQNELDLTNADKINNYIPVQKVKDKIKKNEEIIDISDDVDTIHELYQENTIYEKLLESEE